MAVMLLASMCAFAQSANNEPLKGDVNGDGKVDVADITALVKIIMENGGGSQEETTYYWYVGTTKPTSLSQATTVTSYPAEQIYTNNSGAKSHIFVLTNSDKTVTFINPQLNAPITQTAVDTTSIPGYKIFETAVGTANAGSIKIKISDAPTYYWYVGATQPTALPTDDSQLATGLDAGWRKIGNTKPSAGTVIFDGTAQDEINIASTKVTQYFAINSDVTIGSYDSQGTDQTTSAFTGPTVSNGMNIYTTIGKSKTFGQIIKVK